MWQYISRILRVFIGGHEQGTIISERDNVCQNENIIAESKVKAGLIKSFDGVITSYFNKVGLINEHIYFTQGSIIGNENPQVGDEVTVHAVRSHSEGGWIANSVQILHTWDIGDKEPETPTKEFMIGSVKNIRNQIVQIEASMCQIDISTKKFKVGFKPYKGDWVQIEYWNHLLNADKGSTKFSAENVITVSPLRERKLHGVVTNVFGSYGLINGNVYFPFTSVEKGYRLKQGDHIVALVLESKQVRGEWRANYVIRKSKGKVKNNAIIASKDFGDNSHFVPTCDNCGIEILGETNFGDVLVDQTHKAEFLVR